MCRHTSLQTVGLLSDPSSKRLFQTWRKRNANMFPLISRKTLETTLNTYLRFLKSHREETAAITASKDNDNTLVKAEHKAQLLNTYFHSFFTHEDLSTPNMPDSLYPPILALDSIQKLHMTLNTNKTTGPEQISALILKSCTFVLVAIIQSIFIQLFTSNNLPKNWFSKTGDHAAPANYLSISLIPIICKISEHIIYKHIMNNNFCTGS